MLISVNPFFSMNNLYSQQTMDSYRQQLRSHDQAEADANGANLPPHIYQIVNNALHSLKSKRKYDLCGVIVFVRGFGFGFYFI
jgi:myosin heavy subunit